MNSSLLLAEFWFKTTIIETVNNLRKKFNYIFTTGGIGPTHDDITAESISKAFNLEYGFHNSKMHHSHSDNYNDEFKKPDYSSLIPIYKKEIEKY